VGIQPIGTATIKGLTYDVIAANVVTTPHLVNVNRRTIEISWSMELVFPDFIHDFEPADMEVLDTVVEVEGVIYTGKALVHEARIKLHDNGEYKTTAKFHGIGVLKAVDNMR
jgi:hypothetical protein